MTTTAPLETVALAARLRLGVVRLARKLRQEAEPGITPSMLSALSSLERLGPLTMGELGAAEQVAAPTITRVANALVGAGLVAREADPTDGRVTWVRVTAEGSRLLERSRRRQGAYLAKALRGLEPDELETLERAAGLLERLTGGAK